ncbi:MAG: hypothetical protein NUV77_01005, partial [Thermoguttaceae bacterium]|nr:hypothetical protein [Thermoguttaceae bacterium]
MSPAESDLPLIDSEMLDALVDGELPEPQRRELLERLDRLPGGWRACALAFLEAQCWKESLRARPLPGPRPAEVRPVRLRRRRSMGVGTLLATAASFLVALGLGLGIGSVWTSGPPRGSDERLADVSEGPGAPTLVSRGGSGLEESRQIAGNDSRSAPGPVGPRAANAWGTVRVSLPGRPGLGPHEIELPVTEAERLDDSWFRPAPLPAELCEGLRRLGYEIRQHRELVPAPLDDGRRVVM